MENRGLFCGRNRGSGCNRGGRNRGICMYFKSKTTIACLITSNTSFVKLFGHVYSNAAYSALLVTRIIYFKPDIPGYTCLVDDSYDHEVHSEVLIKYRPLFRITKIINLG